MKICFCSSLIVNQSKVLKKTKTQLMTGQTHKFLASFINGIDECMGEPTYVLNTLDIPSWPRYSQLIFKTYRWQHCANADDLDIGKINISGIKILSEFILLYRRLEQWVEKNKNEELFVITYNRRLSHVLAINMLKRKYKNINTCMILGDLTGKYASTAVMDGSMSFRSKITQFMIDFAMKKSMLFDSFVLLTRQMADVLELEKPYVIIEGIYSEDISKNISNSIVKPNKGKIVILYTGTLQKQYGILNLIKAIKKMDNNKFELWLAGGGNASEIVKEMANKTENIKYFGYISTKESDILISKADILINPRDNDGEYTKYSFPSKTMEYLASGKPVIGCRLDGIPEEYYEYIQVIDDNSVNMIVNKITEVCKMRDDVRKQLGYNARQFVIKRKSSHVQAEKLIDMLRGLR